MAVAFNNKDLVPIMEEDDAKKFKLEKPLIRDMESFLRRINNDFEQEYIANGTVINVNEYKEELFGILLLNYNKISKKFKNNIRESFDDNVEHDIAAKINVDLSRNNRRIDGLHTSLILATTAKQIRRELTNTITEFIDDEVQITNAKIAKETKKTLDSQVKGRAKIIAASEVQTVAETAKTAEEFVLVDNNVVLDDVNLSDSIVDTWVANIDEKTRTPHVAANFQEKKPHELFLVGGEFLKYPGDPSASAANTINCRCSKIVKVA